MSKYVYLVYRHSVDGRGYPKFGLLGGFSVKPNVLFESEWDANEYAEGGDDLKVVRMEIQTSA